MRKLLIVSLVLFSLMYSVSILAAGFQGTIQLWDYPHGDKVVDWWQNVIAQFEESHPGVKIEYTQLTWAGGAQKVNVAIASGMLPDIVNQGTQVEFIEEGLMEDLSSYYTAEDKEDFYPAALNAYQYKDGIYGWPWYLFLYHMYLDKDLFQERDVALPENGEWTYQEFVNKLEKLTFDRDGDGQTDVYGLAYNVQPDYYDFWPVLLSDGAKVFNADHTKFLLNSPEGLSGLKKIIDLDKKYHVTVPNSAGMDQSSQWVGFLQDKTVAVTSTGVWGIGAVNQYNEDLQKKIDKGEDTKGKEILNLAVANYPSGEAGKAQPIVITGGFGVFKQKDKAKTDAIVDFLKFATSAAEQEKIMADTRWLGFLPSRSSVDASKYYSEDENMMAVLNMLDEGIAWPPLVPSWNKIGDKVQRQIQLACLGQITPEQALKNAERDAQRILDQINR